ncbi:hypothetical protein BT93_E1685 [Corymbia citriodora subsp. variegata]|nr:hypothetical protein BT93_E1685 [Corymbia citriodora subsp. variegata]
MASSSKPKRIYHVFLSFRGTDVRNNFLDHLYRALDLKGIYTYVDSEELKKGDQIASALMKAIEESHIAVIIFSEDYASSTWCLEEAVKIMECKEERDLKVFPVFYKVEPREVRTPREKYKEAMDKHESKFGENSEKMKRWKKALLDAGNLSGWLVKEGDDSEHIQGIVKEIATHLGREPLHVAKHLVGIDSRVLKLKSMLNLESNDCVLMVGLWGQGGIGKTTLAKAIYNDIFTQFEGSSFLANVRETSKGCKDLVTLQEKLLNEILLRSQRLVVSSVDVGTNLIRERLFCKKVLLVLDDVDDLRQLSALAGEGKWFGNGSRIIFTTRDEHLLTAHKIDQDHVYEVKALDNSEAHELLTKHAFSTHQKLKIRANLVDGVLNYTKGLPLALEVLGSFLCGRREHEWKSTLKKLSKIPNKSINDVLKISYDGLEENEKEIFLHVACFFKGQEIGYIKKVLGSCDLEIAIGLKILIERSLISIKSGTLQMHDLIQLMGMDIVQQDCRDDPMRRSRLWLYDDVLDVLSYDMGDCAVKAIVLEPHELKEISINPDAFTKMRRLKLLILRNVYNSFQGPVCLPHWLRWFEWPGAPCFPEFSSGPKRLVGLCMSKSSITIVAKQYKDLQQLKYVNLSDCKSLVSMPDLSCTPYLKELDLAYCTNLVEAHESIAKHDKLQILRLTGCSELSVFPDVLESKHLRTLYLDGCTKFERFPDIPNELEDLEELWLLGTAIKELPPSIENLVSLQNMFLDNCKNLEIPELPPSFSYLYAEGCKSLKNNGDLTSLHHFVRRGLSMADAYSSGQMPHDFKIILSGGELLEWVFPVEEGSVSFMASKDLYNKFLALALCFILCDDESEKETLVVSHVNGKRLDHSPHTSYTSELEHISLEYLIPCDLWGEVDFSQIDGSHVRFSSTVLGTRVKKWGLRILCKALEDDLKVELQDNQLMDPALLYEICHESTYLEAESSLIHEDSSIETDLHKDSQDCQMSTENHSQGVSKRNHKLILSRGMQTTSNSIGRDEYSGVGLQLLL